MRCGTRLASANDEVTSDPPVRGLIYVLVVSRDPSTARLLAGMGGAFGVGVTRVDPDHPQALSSDEVRNVDVVVLESDRVDDGGWALVELIRAHSPKVERVVVCGSETTDSAVAAMRSGVRSIVTRPVKRSRLIQAVVGAWARKRREERRSAAQRSQDDG
jgi:two-component system, NtrC family, response regulator